MKVNADDWNNIDEATDNPYKALQLIYDVGYNHDGCEKPLSLKNLIDELTGYAKICLNKAKNRGDIE